MILSRMLAHRGGEKPHALTLSGNKSQPISLNVRVRLQVETDVTPTGAAFLKKNGARLVQIIENTGLKLEFSASTADRDVVHMYQVWDMNGDTNLLVRADLLLPDEPAYSEFDILILKEVKNIVVPITPLDFLQRHDLVKTTKQEDALTKHIRVVHQVTHTHLAEFAAQREACLVGFAEDTGWEPVDAYLGITGISGQIFPIVEIWRIPAAAQQRPTANTRKAIESTMVSAPWQAVDPEQEDGIRVLGATVLPIK